MRASEWTDEEAGGHCYGEVRASEWTGEEAGGNCYGEGHKACIQQQHGNTHRLGQLPSEIATLYTLLNTITKFLW